MDHLKRMSLFLRMAFSAMGGQVGGHALWDRIKATFRGFGGKKSEDYAPFGRVILFG
jgi:hypothetical protein